VDPIEFLAGHAPFNELSAAGRAELARGLEMTFVRAGEKLFGREDVNLHLYTVRKGSVRLLLDGQPVDHIGPGEVFGLTAVAGEDHPSFDAVADSDTLLFRCHRDTIRVLFPSEPRFAAFFLENLSARLHALIEGSPVAFAGDLRVPVADLVDRPPVLLPVYATVGDAARRMNRERVSSVLLVPHEPAPGEPVVPVGILTDRDLRGRVLAAGLGPETPVRDVLSAPLDTIDAALPTSEAILHLLRRGVHHLPVTRDGTVIGVVTHSDLLRHHQHGPGALLKKIEKARSAEALGGYADDVAAMVDTLDRSRLDAGEIGRLVAALNDALVGRLLVRAERDLGPVPCPYAWIVFGSEGRQEQSFLTDQDNALIYEGGDESVAGYFRALAERVVGDLVRVGFPPCAGGFMASQWCDPLPVWRERFASWIQRPEPEALMKVANFFDFRAVHGALALAALEEVIAAAPEQRLFIAHLARAAMEMRPPLGLLHRIREAPEGVDLKAGALMPVVGLARVFALEAGEREGSTLRRLRSAERAGIVSRDGAEVLAEAFRFAFALRLRTQLAGRRAGAPIDNRVHLDALSPGERRHLKESFLAIRRMQSATEDRLAVARLG
jgi:CBS domain-containing protein